MTISKDLLDELQNGCERPEDPLGGAPLFPASQGCQAASKKTTARVRLPKIGDIIFAVHNG